MCDQGPMKFSLDPSNKAIDINQVPEYAKTLDYGDKRTIKECFDNCEKTNCCGAALHIHCAAI